ncbi:MAG: carboxypeptidase-like regulatory domain-containing protein [Bacteroidales bacterium]|jgi:hypothetical protein|nr:carboxypeptidase-like regulatory domain-containing protein [Bacteroidales bacterium]
MKKKILIFAVPFFFAAVLIVIYLLNGCRKDVQSISNKPYLISGKVINTETDAPLPNVTISVQGIAHEYTTNSEGIFTFYVYKKQNLNAIAKKEGFVDKAFEIISITGGFYSVKVKMKPLGTSANIGASGGLFVTTNYLGNEAQIEIPAGALSTNKTLSATSVWGSENPKINLNEIVPIEALFLSPENIILNKEASVTLTAPFELSEEQHLLVSKYNFESRTWDIVATDISIEVATATFKISSFGLYILEAKGSFNEELKQEYTETIILDESEKSIYLTPTLEFLSDTLYDIPIEYLKGILNQYYQVEFNKPNEYFLNNNIPLVPSLKSSSLTSTTTICFDICWYKYDGPLCVPQQPPIFGYQCVPVHIAFPYPCNWRKCHEGGSGN